MSEYSNATGHAAFFMMARLIQQLVLREVLTIEDAKELVDAALLDAEELFPDASQSKATRYLLETFLKDLDRPGSS